MVLLQTQTVTGGSATIGNNGKGVTLFQLIPAREFRELCDRFNIDKGVRKLTAQKQVWALVTAFLFKLESLRVSRLKKCSYSKWRHKKLLLENVGKDGIIRDWNWKPSCPVLRKAPHVPKYFTLRHITYRDSETKKVFDFITSDFQASAESIASIYKKRWAVELLFRWLKGHLKIRSLEPKNTNAIKIQLIIAVLVQLLLQLYRMLTKFDGTLWEYLRLLRTNGLRRLFTKFSSFPMNSIHLSRLQPLPLLQRHAIVDFLPDGPEN
jgi:hypothetical protein